MFVLRSNGSSAVVPGFLLGLRGDAMMPEYERYMVTLPFFLAASAVCVVMSGHALVSSQSRAAFAAFAFFMFIFSARMLSQRLVRVSLVESDAAAEIAPFAIRLNNVFTALSLLLLGASFARFKADASPVLFHMLGYGMIAMSIAALIALRRRDR